MTDESMRRRYERAEAFLPWNFRGLIRNAAIEPFWIDERRFWRKHETPFGWRYEIVDAETAERAPAFDHEALAAALTRAGEQADADRLALDWIAPGEDGLVFALRAARFRFDGDALTALGGPVWRDAELPSPDRRTGAFRRGDDLWLRDIESGEERRLTDDGAPLHGYAASPGSTLEAVTQRRSGRQPLPVVAWSPDSRFLATHRLDERRVRQMHMVEAAPRDGSAVPRLHSWPMAAAGDAELPLVDHEQGGAEQAQKNQDGDADKTKFIHGMKRSKSVGRRSTRGA